MISARLIGNGGRQLVREMKRIDRGIERVKGTAARRAGRSTVALFSRETRKDIPVKASRLKKLARVTGRGSRTRIVVSGAHVPLTDMGARQTKKGVTYSPRRSKRTRIPGAFIATMDSGHRGVFVREKGKYMRKRQGQTKHSQAIRELFGPSGIGMWRKRERMLRRHAGRQMTIEFQRAIRRL